MTKSSILYPLLISIVFFVVVTLNIQLSPMKGIADNGDFGRIMTWYGLRHQTQSVNGEHLDWVDRYYIYGGTKLVGNEYTSGLIFISIAKLINSLFNVNVFDLKILGIIHTFIVSGLLFFVLYYLRKINKYILLLIIPFIFLVLIDTNYVAYFNSFYEETSGIIFLLLYLVVLMKLLSVKLNKYTKLDHWLIVLSSMLLVSAKPQYFILFLPILMVTKLIFNKMKSKLFVIVFSIFISVYSLSYYLICTPNIIKQWNIYNTVFAQIMGSTNNINRAGKILGVDNKYYKYAGVAAYIDDTGVKDTGIQQYLLVGTYLRVIEYYLSTPHETYNLLRNLSNISLNTNIPFLGYYEQGNGDSYSRAPQNGVIWSSFKAKIGGYVGQFIPYYLIISFVLLTYIYVYRKNIYSIIGIFLSLSALSQFLIVLVSEGVFGVPEKHLLMFNILFDILMFFWTVYFLTFFAHLLLEIVEKIGKVELSTKLGMNTKFYVGDRRSKKLYENTNWEPDVLAFIDGYAKGDVFEIGSHVGIHSIYLAKKIGMLHTVCAFEPSPRSYKLLKKNCLEYHNVIPINLAVNDGLTNKTRLHHYFGFSAWDNITQEGRFVKEDRPFIRRIFSKTMIVNSISIDKFISNNNGIRPTFIKIDAENSEMSIIRGAKITLSSYKPAIVFEGGDLGRKRSEKTNDILNVLVGIGYHIYSYNYRTKSIIPHKIRNKYVDTVNLLALPKNIN